MTPYPPYTTSIFLPSPWKMGEAREEATWGGIVNAGVRNVSRIPKNMQPGIQNRVLEALYFVNSKQIVHLELNLVAAYFHVIVTDC
jgi:hypothetical protein